MYIKENNTYLPCKHDRRVRFFVEPKGLSSRRISLMRSVLSVLLIVFAGVCTVDAEGAAAATHKPERTDDGLEFSINRKSFKISQFELWGRTFDDNYGFADSSVLPLDNRGYSEVCSGMT